MKTGSSSMGTDTFVKKIDTKNINKCSSRNKEICIWSLYIETEKLLKTNLIQERFLKSIFID